MQSQREDDRTSRRRCDGRPSLVHVEFQAGRLCLEQASMGGMYRLLAACTAPVDPLIPPRYAVLCMKLQSRIDCNENLYDGFDHCSLCPLMNPLGGFGL